MRTCLVSGSGLLAILALAALTACGGAAVDLVPAPCESTAPTGCSDPQPNVDSVPIPSSSSKLFVFDTVTRSDGTRDGSSVLLPTERASIGNQARLDIEKQFQVPGPPSLIVTLAPRWGAVTTVTTVLPTKLAPNKLTLNGKVAFSSSGEVNEWTSITLDLDAKGELAGTFTAVGTLQVVAGDVVDSYPVTGTGHLANDTIAPEIRLASPMGSRNGKFLPWDSLSVQLAEPLHLTDIQPTLTSSVAGIDWSPAQDDAKGWNSGLIGKPRGFDLAGQTPTMRGPASGSDPSNNPIGTFATPVAFQSLGAATVDHHDLDSGLTGAIWGSAAFASDARCEKGGCVVFPSISANDCGGAPGFVGRLTPTVFVHTLHARVKVLASDGYGGATAAPFVYEPFRIEGATAAGTTFRSSLPSIDGLTRTAEDPELPWATAWKTIDVPITFDSPEIGFAIVRPFCDSGPGGLPYPDSKVSVRIDEVWVD